MKRNNKPTDAFASPHPYVGVQVSADAHVGYGQVPNGHYNDALGDHWSACQGCYTATGEHTDYVNSNGFTVICGFNDRAPHHAGMVQQQETGA